MGILTKGCWITVNWGKYGEWQREFKISRATVITAILSVLMVILLIVALSITLVNNSILNRLVKYQEQLIEVYEEENEYLRFKLSHLSRAIELQKELEIILEHIFNGDLIEDITNQDLEGLVSGDKLVIQHNLSRALLERSLREMNQYGEDIVEYSQWLDTTPAGMPTGGRITSGFGWRGSSFHRGIDISAKIGTPVKSTADGTVIVASREGNYGNLIVIDHGKGYKTYYAHLDTLKVAVRQRVSRGEVIGTTGNTGYSLAPHLHYEVHYNNEAINPRGFLEERR